MTNLRMMAVDDEPLALGDLTRAIEAEVDDCSLHRHHWLNIKILF